METNPEWGWMKQTSENAHGPFPTRELAIADAQEYIDDESDGHEYTYGIIIGHAIWPDPGEHVHIDCNDLAERMDENAVDNNCCYTGDDELFEFTDRKEAQKALDELLSTWARKWLQPSSWTLEEVEKMDMTAKP